MVMDFNKEQLKAINGEEALIVDSAGAGSGKTRVLSERYVHLCELKLNHHLGYSVNAEMGAEAKEIVTLTFTEDAALEMRDRIRKRLVKKMEQAESEYPRHAEEARLFWKMQMESLDTAIISTFHSFCQRILQENSLEAGLHPDFQVIDDVQSKLLKAEIYDKLVEEAEQNQKWQTLLNSVPWGLRESVFLIYGKISEYERKGSLRETLNVEAMAASWHMILDEFQADFYRLFESGSKPSKLSKANQQTWDVLCDIHLKNVKGEDLFERLQSDFLANKKTVPKTLGEQFPELYNLGEKWLRARELWTYLKSSSHLVEEVLFEFVDFLEAFDQEYAHRKHESALLDFSDLQQKAIRLMDNPDVQRHYSSMYLHFLIDEMQDTNDLQLRMIEKINPACRFIVGDGKQSIYKFRGADVQIFNRLIKEASNSSHYSFIDMNTNYRTCASIIQFINLLFDQPHLMGVTLGQPISSYQTEYSKMEAHRNEGQETERRVEWIKVSGEQEKSQVENQYIMIARRMVQLMKEGTPIYDKDLKVWRPVEWRDMAVLIAARTNLTKLELALQKYDIPYTVFGGIGFYERLEVVDFLSLLQWLNKPYEPMYMMAVLRGPLFGVTMEEFLEIQHGRGNEDMASFIYKRQFRSLGLEGLQTKLELFCRLYEKWVPFPWAVDIRLQLLRLFEDSGLKKALLLQKNNLMKIKNVEKVMETMNQFQAASMDQMLAKMAILADLSEKEGDAEVELTGGNFIHIMTVHGSKGLEFPVVFVPNLSKKLQSEKLPFRYDVEQGLAVKVKVENEEDLLANAMEHLSPNFNSIHSLSGKQAVEESKRLFYVALTRARDLLILSSKDKGERNTWHSWLEEALEVSGELQDLVQIKEGIEEQAAVEAAKDIYEGPKVKLERSIPITFSVSEVMSYLDNPDAFLEKHLLKLEEGWLDAAEDTNPFTSTDNKLDAEPIEDGRGLVDARNLGTVVHRICELLDKGYPETEAYLEAFAAIHRQEEKDAYLKEVQPLIKAYLSKDFGEPLENEWEFVLEIDGVQILGEIDKVIRKEGGLEVLDLKTNRIDGNLDELINYYRTQLYLYKMAYEKIAQSEIRKMSLVFLRDPGQGIYEIDYDPSFQKKLLAAIQEMARLKRELE